MATADTYLYPGYAIVNDDILSDPTVVRAGGALTIDASITLGAVTLSAALAAIDTLTASITLGAVTLSAVLASPTLPENVYIMPTQVFSWRVQAQLRQTYTHPVKYRGYLQALHDRDYMIPVQRRIFTAPAYNRVFIILNPTDS